MNRHLVRTPEHAVFAYDLAGPASRAAAWLFDRVIVLGAAAASGVVLSVTEALSEGLGIALFLVVYFVLDWGYHVVFEWHNGRTPGKALVGLRVLSERGLRLTIGQSMVRNLFRLIDMLPVLYLAGGALTVRDRLGRRLGDLAAGAVVVRDRRTGRPGVLGRLSDPGRVGALPAEEAARARRRATPAERDAVLALALRREDLDLPVRVFLFEILSDHLRDRLGLPRPPGLSPENHVLRLAAALAAAPPA